MISHFLIFLGILSVIAVAIFGFRKQPSTLEELMAAIDDLKAAVERLEKVRDKVVANVPADLTPAINEAKDRVNAVSDSLEATLPKP